MMKTEGSAVVLPPASFPRIKLEGEQHTIKILWQIDWGVCVEYPDGARRNHQAHDVITLLDKITGKLKTVYNIDSFQFLTIPKDLSTGETLTIGDIKYA